MRVHANGLQCLNARLRIAAHAVVAELTAAVANKDQLHLVLKRIQLGDIIRGEAAAAENADVRKLVEIRGGDGTSLHAAHRKPGHRAMRLVSNRAEICIHERNQILDEHPRKGGRIIAASTRPPDGPGIFLRCRRLIGRTEAKIRAINIAVRHDDDERLGFSGGDEVIHDERRAPLATPAGFVLAPAVL